jgi:hypothetical protein
MCLPEKISEASFIQVHNRSCLHRCKPPNEFALAQGFDADKKRTICRFASGEHLSSISCYEEGETHCSHCCSGEAETGT